MMKVKRLIAVAATIAMVGAVALPAFAAGSEVTVGRFVQELAKIKNLNATDAEIAADSLAAVGVRLPADINLSKRLTEADVAKISRLAGVRVSTSNPERPFSDDQVDQFFVAFGEDLAGDEDDDFDTRNGETPGGESGSANGNGPGFNPYTKGKGGAKGKKKGHGPVSPTEPE